ncbi:MAG: L,D-transpeptidase family protein [Candidatus Thiodiazotropha lotti]|uniref:L,D-TPase catalytic domain-containing protein n=1 Tax=Candidatus Thiodiazotropha endoloripes TaxID=1818881 RepID=A0A1E2UJP7_9GAMM|nr:L,D-transpeptidase family protein [Candidatus Thiodiazotropha endoloripes]MCG7898969.1 L,D-transpeptidase family protein [Candidatus Thiodiazotropha weberae]MCG7992779.1 L,D-transpeptidase family protein [Candidatus Thiodiazotropha lotti]MCG7901772.1 L,D-transpeptidase family protein [Candidatus Thiodiazotropha weberae]MCG7912359.1 L,D-transpeptidase family protein [Candidatus Thiodiazotropha weberae]MCG7998844.1 L,D-transpeptidase family protein [Candidatus Thiodiazotropha lotti]
MRFLILLLVSGWALAAQASPNGSLEAVMERLDEDAGERIAARFEQAGVDYPPQRVQLIALKESRRLELWAYSRQRWWFIHDYAIFAASGEAGPKLREGDKQVPEGFYRIVGLNPNSHFHLSMRLNYPNAFDWVQAGREDRHSPGSNIYIHGSAWSAGCLAIGNHYIEELFYLVARLGVEKAAVLIVPYDFRSRAVTTAEEPVWLDELYRYLKLRLAKFPLSEKRLGCGLGCARVGYGAQLAPN